MPNPIVAAEKILEQPAIFIIPWICSKLSREPGNIVMTAKDAMKKNESPSPTTPIAINKILFRFTLRSLYFVNTNMPIIPPAIG